MIVCCRVAEPRFGQGALWLLCFASVGFPSAVHPADPERVKADKVEFVDNENGKAFARPEAACADYAKARGRGTFTKLDDYKEGDATVRCLWKTPEGDEEGQVGVSVRAMCPIHSNSYGTDVLRTRECECDSGFVAKGGKCVEEGQAAEGSQAGASTGSTGIAAAEDQDEAQAGKKKPKDQQGCEDAPEVPPSFTADRARQIHDAIYNVVKTSGWKEAELYLFKDQGNVGIARVCIANKMHIYVGVKVPKGTFGAVDAKTGKPVRFYEPKEVGDWVRKNALSPGEELADVVVNPQHAEDAAKDAILDEARARNVKNLEDVTGSVGAATPVCYCRCRPSWKKALPGVTIANPESKKKC